MSKITLSTDGLVRLYGGELVSADAKVRDISASRGAGPGNDRRVVELRFRSEEEVLLLIRALTNLLVDDEA